MQCFVALGGRYGNDKKVVNRKMAEKDGKDLTLKKFVLNVLQRKVKNDKIIE